MEGFPPPVPARPDPAAYRRAVEEPVPLVVAAAVDPLPGLRAAAVELSPVRQTKEGTVELCTSFTISLRFTDEPEVADREESAKLLSEELGRDIDPERLQLLPDGPKEVTAEDLEVARELVINPEIFADVPVVVLQRDSAYLIITDDRTWDAATMRPNGERGGSSRRRSPASGAMTCELMRPPPWCGPRRPGCRSGRDGGRRCGGRRRRPRAR